MATSRINIGGKFQNTDIPSQDDFKEIFDSFVHKDEDKANFQMVETGTDDQHYVTPALLRTGLQNIGIITGNSYMPFKEHFDNFIGNTLPLQYSPVKFSAKAFKNGQLLLEKDVEGNEGDYIINYDTAVITFSSNVDNRNIEVDYWYKNLSPNPGGGSTPQIDFTSFLHTSGNETKDGLLTFNNTAPTSTSGIVLTNSGVGSASTSLDVTNSGTGSGISLQNSSTGTGVKVSNAGAGVAVNLNSATGSTGDILQVAKNNVVQTKIDSAGTITAPKFVTAGGLRSQFIKGDGFPDPTVYAEDTKVIHTEGNELRDGALNLTHDDAVQDVLTITKNNSANCLKLIQNSSSNATTSTFDTTTENVNRKAISIQKVHVEKAFITHEGNVSGTSFTTLNEKADITDGFLTLGGSDSPAAMSGHAKLYAKTDGTTDMYVMGSDGVEKKIGDSASSGALLTTTDQSFTGIKSVTNDGVTLNNGMIFTNNASGLYPILTVTNTSSAWGLEVDNTGEGSGMRLSNSSNIGIGAIVSNYYNSTGLLIKNFGTGIGIYGENNSSGDALVLNGETTSSGFLYVGKNNGSNTFTVNKTGDIKGNSFVKTGGTAAQFLKADGSVDTNTYLKNADLNNYVDVASFQSISGAKTFTATTNFSNPVFINNENSIFFTASSVSYSKDITRAQVRRFSNDIALASANSNFPVCINTLSLTTIQTLTAPNATGTIALTNNPTPITATSFIKSGGTSSQYLMADGSVSTSAIGGGATSGTYTPIVSNISAITGVPSVLKAVYTKIGNLVTVTCRMVATNDDTGDYIVPSTRIFFITLPFPAVGDSASVIVMGTNNDGSNSFGAIIGGADGTNATKAVIDYSGVKSSLNHIQFTMTYNVS